MHVCTYLIDLAPCFFAGYSGNFDHMLYSNLESDNSSFLLGQNCTNNLSKAAKSGRSSATVRSLFQENREEKKEEIKTGKQRERKKKEDPFSKRFHITSCSPLYTNQLLKWQLHTLVLKTTAILQE